jgi:hypothetical protein
MIDGVKANAAAWTSFLITINNFFRVLVIEGVVFFINLLITILVVAVLAGFFKVVLPSPLVLDYPSYLKVLNVPSVALVNKVFGSFLLPIETVILTLGYLKFTKEISYPALIRRHSTA